jgi:hypothetical protein
MSQRLEVLVDEAEFREVQAAARRQGMPVSDWVRRVLREACRPGPRCDIDRKLRVIRSAVRHDFPATDIEPMIEEIERRPGDGA